MQKKQFYKTLSEAKLAAQQLGIQSTPQYALRYKEDPRLPCSPRTFYTDAWKGWYNFLGKTVGNRYAIYAEASKIAQQLGIKYSNEYRKRYKEDPRLHCYPPSYYKDDWTNWDDFLGKPLKYKTYAEASKAAQELGIRSSTQYKSEYKKDPRLVCSPYNTYRDVWPGWACFLDQQLQKPYATYAEASAAAQRINIKSSTQYNKNYHKDPKLCSTPWLFYADDWKNWYIFLDTAVNRYLTYAEASTATLQLGIKSASDYKKNYRKDPKLPSTPWVLYLDDWTTWSKFLCIPVKIKYATYHEARQAAQRLGITSSIQYKNNYKKDPKLHSSPHRFYLKDWTNWYDFLNTAPEWYTYKNAMSVVQKLGIKTGTEYKIRYKEDPRLPSNPKLIYPNDWNCWKSFLGVIKEGPLSGAFSQFSETCPAWKEAAEKYILESRSQNSKASTVRMFLLEFIIPTGMTDWPGQLLDTKTSFPKEKYESFVNNASDSGKIIRHKNSIGFLEWILERYCSDESENGELIRFPGYRNPLVTLMSHLSAQQEPYRPSESVKPVLPMSIIIRARNHLIPNGSNFFSDIAGLHPFLQDNWFEVDSSVIDTDDPDCIWREKTISRKKNGIISEDKIIQIWSPVKLIALYTLLILPLRGQQICWLDSGESDAEIPVLDHMKKINWIKNPMPLGEYKRKQGFIKKYANDQLGMYVTTNKTGSVAGGYSVPYMPEDLAYWIIRLRDWQTKYNKIDALTRWTQIRLKQLININILKARGSQTFLFRDPCSKDETRRSPIHTPVAFSNSLPALLMAIQKPGEELAKKHPRNLFKSPFTPHSLRTSIITAFVIDGGAPVNIVMKLVGHHSLVMTLYYSKVGPYKMTSELEEAEKRALLQNVDRLKDLTFSKKIEEAKSQLISTDSMFINNLDDQWPVAAYQFTDWGLCPMSGSGCDTGGTPITDRDTRGLFAPVEAGYLGKRNCPRCRYFITGPAWLGGLQALSNEIILEINTVREEFHDFEYQREQLEDAKFDIELSGNLFEQHKILNQTTSALEERTQKLDMLLCDFQQVYSLINQCIALLNKNNSNNDEKNQLIVSSGKVVEAMLQESKSDFRLLASICRDAEFYQAASASRATPKMAQLIDRFADKNGFSPGLFKLSEAQQRKAANQISSLLLTRLNGNWDLAEQIVTGNLQLSDLGTDEFLEPLKLNITAALEGKLQQSLEVKYVGP